MFKLLIFPSLDMFDSTWNKVQFSFRIGIKLEFQIRLICPKSTEAMKGINSMGDVMEKEPAGSLAQFS